MMSAALQTTLIIAIVTLAVAAVCFVGFRILRASRDLGTDADRVTYETLHRVSLAAPHLSSGLTAEGAARASRHLRALLGCEGLAITDTTTVLATEGSLAADPLASPVGSARGSTHDDTPGSTPAAPPHAGDARAAGLFGIAAGALAAQRTQVLRRDGLDVVCAPILVRGQAVGTVISLAAKTNAGLARATTEVAAWVAAQVGLAELDASRALLMEAEVRALRAQISPHFIYNSLNAIASFIITDPQRARQLVVEFADFTRYSFRRHGDFTTLAEELQAIDRYLLLEKARFGDRIRVSLAIAPEVLSTVIPFLSLQPLVENAVRHGLEGKDGGGLITLTASDAGEYAEITVEDDGVGIDPDALREVLAGNAEGVHVGLRNVDVRLRQVYGQGHGLVIDTAPGAGTLITLRVPKFQPGNDAGPPASVPDGRAGAGGLPRAATGP